MMDATRGPLEQWIVLILSFQILLSANGCSPPAYGKPRKRRLVQRSPPVSACSDATPQTCRTTRLALVSPRNCLTSQPSRRGASPHHHSSS